MKGREPDKEEGIVNDPPSTTPLYCGVDVGASATKLVMVNEQGKVLSRVARKSGVEYKASSRSCLNLALNNLKRSEIDIKWCVATGYGRNNVDFSKETLTEITSHGVGCYHYFPESMVIVDIGAQDSKVIKLDLQGQRQDFKMNRKCAAGTGAFLEEIATRMEIPLGELDRLARGADKKLALGSFCTVFAKTEILAFLRKGERVENIIRGAFQSVVNRIIEMDRLEGTVVLTGGVVQYNSFLKEALAETLGKEVRVPPNPQFTGALGAALTAIKSSVTKDS